MRGIVVTGTGAAENANTEVVLELAAVTVRATAQQAFAAASAAVHRLLQVLADDGVDARSVRTENLTLGPRYSYAKEQQQLLGYEARQDLRARLVGLSDLDRILADIAALGDECRIESLRLAPTDLRPGLARARAEAMRSARDAAAELAAAAGRTLGAVRFVRESGDGQSAGPLRAVATGVAPGQDSVRVSVQVGYDLD